MAVSVVIGCIPDSRCYCRVAASFFFNAGKESCWVRVTQGGVLRLVLQKPYLPLAKPTYVCPRELGTHFFVFVGIVRL